MGQIGVDFEHPIVMESFEKLDLGNGYFAIQRIDGLVLTVDEGGNPRFEPLHDPRVPHQQFTIQGGVVTAWPTGEANVSFRVQVRP